MAVVVSRDGHHLDVAVVVAVAKAGGDDGVGSNTESAGLGAISIQVSILFTFIIYTVPKVFDFPRYNTKCSREKRNTTRNIS